MSISKTYSFRLDSYEDAQIAALAAKRSMSTHRYCRMVIRQHLARVVPSVLDDERSVDEMQADYEEATP